MQMRIELRLRDRDGNRRTCSIPTGAPVLLSQAVALAQGYETVIAAMSNAHVVSGSISLSGPTDSQLGGPDSDVSNKLLLVTNQDSDYSSIVIPSPRLDLPYDTSGSYVDIRIRPQNEGTLTVFGPLLAYLAECVNPDGSPFVVGPWVAARMLNQ